MCERWKKYRKEHPSENDQFYQNLIEKQKMNNQKSQSQSQSRTSINNSDSNHRNSKTKKYTIDFQMD